MPNLVSLTYPVFRYWTKLRRIYFWFMYFSANSKWKKIVITPEPVMILTWNLDQLLNLTRKTRKRQKNWRWRCLGELWRHRHFSDLQLIQSKAETGFLMHGLWYLHFLSLIITFYLTKTEGRTKKSLTQLWNYCFE